MSDRLPAAASASLGRPASIAVSHPAAAAEAAVASTSGFQPAHRRKDSKDSLPTPTKDELRYKQTNIHDATYIGLIERGMQSHFAAVPNSSVIFR